MWAINRVVPASKYGTQLSWFFFLKKEAQSSPRIIVSNLKTKLWITPKKTVTILINRRHKLSEIFQVDSWPLSWHPEFKTCSGQWYTFVISCVGKEKHSKQKLTFGIHKILGNSWAGERMVALRVELTSVQYFSSLGRFCDGSISLSKKVCQTCAHVHTRARAYKVQAVKTYRVVKCWGSQIV
jgi:hypothetical protein